MTLEHKLCVAGAGIPELDTSVLGARKDPLGIGSESNTEDKILCRHLC